MCSSPSRPPKGGPSSSSTHSSSSFSISSLLESSPEDGLRQMPLIIAAGKQLLETTKTKQRMNGGGGGGGFGMDTLIGGAKKEEEEGDEGEEDRKESSPPTEKATDDCSQSEEDDGIKLMGIKAEGSAIVPMEEDESEGRKPGEGGNAPKECVPLAPWLFPLFPSLPLPPHHPLHHLPLHPLHPPHSSALPRLPPPFIPSLLKSPSGGASFSPAAAQLLLAAGGWPQVPHPHHHRHHHQHQQGQQHKRKGGQIRFTNEQTDMLEGRFEEQKYLNNTQRKALAKQLELSERQVKTWFQNRRAKWRRQAPAGTDCPSDEDAGAADMQQHLQLQHNPFELYLR